MQDYDYNRRAPWGIGFTRVVIEKGVTSIGKYAFYHCADLEEITIPSTVIKSGAYAFDECRKMKNIHISDIASWISLQIPEYSPKYAAPNDFSSECHLYIGNTKVTKITIPAGTTSLREGLFRACVDLTSVTLPGSVKEIGESAFRGCSSLQNINIPAGVESIDPFVFAGCSSLEEIALPDSVKVLQGYAFAYCTSLESIELPERELAFASAVFEGCTALQSITIPDGTTSIMSYLFQDCSNLENVTIPDSVKYIREGVFQNCTSLKTILIPDSVIDLGQDPFDGCSQLTIQVYHHTSYAAGWAAENNYTYEIVHQNLTYQAPVEATCTDAGTGVCWVCPLCGKIFADAEGTEEIEAAEEVPASNHAWGEATYTWNADHTQVTASRSCANNAAHNQSETVNATYRVEPPTENQAGTLYITAVFTNEAFRLPEVTVIPALEDMNVLRLPAQLATIEAGAFTGTDCEAVIIPDGCEAIGAGAFANCRELVYVLIPASVINCAEDAFNGCPKAILDVRQAKE